MDCLTFKEDAAVIRNYSALSKIDMLWMFVPNLLAIHFLFFMFYRNNKCDGGGEENVKYVLGCTSYLSWFPAVVTKRKKKLSVWEYTQLSLIILHHFLCWLLFFFFFYHPFICAQWIRTKDCVCLIKLSPWCIVAHWHVLPSWPWQGNIDIESDFMLLHNIGEKEKGVSLLKEIGKEEKKKQNTDSGNVRHGK